jgi:hypothetical protein
MLARSEFSRRSASKRRARHFEQHRRPSSGSTAASVVAVRCQRTRNPNHGHQRGNLVTAHGESVVAVDSALALVRRSGAMTSTPPTARRSPTLTGVAQINLVRLPAARGKPSATD